MTQEELSKLLRHFIAEYGPNAGEFGPERFVREVLKAEPEEYQLDLLRAFGRGDRRISFRSCHGVGKTTGAAWLCTIMLCTRFPQKTAITAPTKGQLEDALMSEIEMWMNQLPPELRELYNITKHRIEFIPDPAASFLTAKTARDENPEALQGVHSDHVLLVGDEASGIAEKVFEASAGSMSGKNRQMALFSNPVRTTGFFHSTHHELADQWHTIHVTGEPGTTRGPNSYYSPRVPPDFLKQIADTYGRSSNAYRVRALGEFPHSDADTIVPYELIELAQQREIEFPEGMSEVWGLDVARFGDDDNALVRRNRLCVLPLIQTWNGIDLMKTTGRLKRAYDDAEVKPDLILIDEIGYGAAVVDRGRELGLPVRGVNVSERDGVDERYHNLRTELWFKGREWLDGRNRGLPARCNCGKCHGKEDHAFQLAQQLARTKYAVAESSGKLLAEPKSAMKKRGYKSPNIADAYLLTLAGDVATLMHGKNKAKSSKPLRRRRSMV